MQKRLLVALLSLCLMTATGCVSIPHEQLSRAIETQELSDHVHFLAQPALKGRKPKTWESATVRRYLKDRFEAYGLVPWPGTKGYEQPFGFGTNVIGILPGSDPNLANEIVILAAHYDHLGKRKKGIYHGASDNASGVAMLLEIAEQFSMAEQKPKRSVCFASFDCEEQMLLGSFVFTCREDVEEANIVGIVNVDTLGRNFFDVVENTLWAIGTRKYPKLRQQIIKAGDDMGIDIAVLGADFVGPRGDHVPFETMEIPCLFFTCGHHSDYHMPTDTTDKLNYDKIKQSAGVIYTTVCNLANAKTIEQPVTPNSGDIEEIETLKLNMAQISENYEKAGLTKEQGEQIADLCTEVDKLLSQDEYSVQDRQKFLWKAGPVFGPLAEDPTAPKKPVDSNEAKIGAKYGMATFGMFYANHRVTLVEGSKKFVKHLVKYKPGFFNNMPKFEHKVYELNDDGISFLLQENGEYLLAVLPARITISGEVSGWLLFKRGRFGMGGSFSPVDCKGTKEQIIDFCLLQLGDNLEDKDHIKVWQKVLRVVVGAERGQTYDEWMRWRLDNCSWKSEKEWVLGLMQSENSHLAAAAVASAQRIACEDAKKVLRKIILDECVKANVRVKAISTLTKDAGPEAMMALVDVADNNTPCHSREDYLYMEQSYPFYDHPGVRLMSEMTDNWYIEKGKSITIGSKAREKLCELTKKDFGKNAKAWRRWIEANVK